MGGWAQPPSWVGGTATQGTVAPGHGRPCLSTSTRRVWGSCGEPGGGGLWGLRGALGGSGGTLGTPKRNFPPWRASPLAAKGAETAPRWVRGGSGLGGWFQGAETRGRRLQGKVGPPPPPAPPLSPGVPGSDCRAWRWPSPAGTGTADKASREGCGASLSTPEAWGGCVCCYLTNSTDMAPPCRAPFLLAQPCLPARLSFGAAPAPRGGDAWWE